MELIKLLLCDVYVILRAKGCEKEMSYH